MAKFFHRSYFNKVQFQIQKYKILGDGHFNILLFLLDEFLQRNADKKMK